MQELGTRGAPQGYVSKQRQKLEQANLEAQASTSATGTIPRHGAEAPQRRVLGGLPIPSGNAPLPRSMGGGGAVRRASDRCLALATGFKSALKPLRPRLP